MFCCVELSSQAPAAYQKSTSISFFELVSYFLFFDNPKETTAALEEKQELNLKFSHGALISCEHSPAGIVPTYLDELKYRSKNVQSKTCWIMNNVSNFRE